MKNLTKTIIASGLAIASATAFACGDPQYKGNYTNGTKIISVNETARCQETYIYREWAPGQQPDIRNGKPVLTLISTDDNITAEYDKTHFRRRNGEEYLLSIPEGVSEDASGYAKRITLEIKKGGRLLKCTTFRRICG